jgi:xanthine dehydrogenase YagS FAD-binding subunit
MRRFHLIEARSLKEAASLLEEHGAAAHPLAGGADLFSLLRSHVPDGRPARPRVLVSLASIRGLGRIRYARGKGLKLGAMALVADLQGERAVRDKYRGIGQAAAEVGSPEVRRTVTLGGNLCQRPRCAYFRRRDAACLKNGGAGCPALRGDHRYYQAILEGGPCHMVHPSDLAPALIAAGATAHLVGRRGTRSMPLERFFLTPSENVAQENVLAPGELLAEVRVPDPAPGTRSAYVKARVDPSWDYALASAAVSLVLREDLVQDARVVLGGVAPRPYRALEAERILRHAAMNEGLVQATADAAVEAARPMRLNSYKVDLARAVVRQAVAKAFGGPIPPAPGPVLQGGKLVCCHVPIGPVRCRGCPDPARPRR